MARLGVAALMKDLQNLDHGQRAGRIGQLGSSLDPAELDRLIESLRAYADYGAHVSIALARHAGRAELLERFVSHDSAFVRGHATRMLFHAGATDELVEHTFRSASTADRATIISNIRSWRRATLAEHLIANAELTEKETARLLPACSPSVVEALLPSVEHIVSSWAPLAKAHPDQVLAYLFDRLDSEPRTARAALLRRWSSAFGELASTRPRRLLELVGRVPDVDPWLLVDHLPVLIRREPELTAGLLVGLRNLAPVVRTKAVRRELRHLRPIDEASGIPSALLTIAQRLSYDEIDLAALLAAVAPSARGPLLDYALKSRVVDDLVLSDAVLDVLPGAVRAPHVRRMLALREFASSPERSLHLSAFLPFDDALPTLAATPPPDRTPSNAQRPTGCLCSALVAVEPKTRSSDCSCSSRAFVTTRTRFGFKRWSPCVIFRRRVLPIAMRLV